MRLRPLTRPLAALAAVVLSSAVVWLGSTRDEAPEPPPAAAPATSAGSPETTASEAPDPSTTAASSSPEPSTTAASSSPETLGTGGTPAPDEPAPSTGTPRSRSQSEAEPDQPPATYAPAPDPAAGCGTVGGDVVRIVFDGAALSPRCVVVGGDQRIVVENRSGIEAGVYAGTVMETVAPGDTAQFGAARAAFDGTDRAVVWVSGFPQAVTTLAAG